ncbi:hypothetical protein KFU94_42615 [Chloroflexi bacterium TSY]|nr:hypothetical protein [Chloroflexi bacterium TSY]
MQSMVLARLDRLASELKEVLQRAAVIGRIFSKRLLAQLLPPGLNLAEAMATLTDYTFIYQERTVPDVEYSFKHVLVQEAVYQTTLQQQRQAFHRQVAEAMAQLYEDSIEEIVEQLAYHYDRSNEVKKAIEYLLKAGEKARRAYLHDVALEYFQTVLTYIDKQRDEVDESLQRYHLDAIQGLGRTHVGKGSRRMAEPYLRQAIALGREMDILPAELVQVFAWLGEVLSEGERRAEERCHLGKEGLALVGEETQSVEAATMNAHTAWGYYFMGNIAKAREYTLRNTKFILKLPYSELLRPAYTHIFMMHAEFDKKIDEALQWAEVWRRKAQQYHDLKALAILEQHLAWVVLWPGGDLKLAILRLQSALEQCIRTGSVPGQGLNLLLMTTVSLELGDLNSAEEYRQRTLQAVEDMSLGNQIWLYEVQGVLMLCRQEWRNAVEFFQKSIQLAQEANIPTDETLEIYRLGTAYLSQGKRTEALRHLQTAIARLALHSENSYFSIPFYARILILLCSNIL